jgi:hypothetical protein
MKAPVDAARLLRQSNPVPDDAFAGAAGDSLGRATFERIISRSPDAARITARPLRRWRFALRWTAAAAALAAAAVALAAIELPDGTEGPAAAAASVVKRVDSALSAAGPGEIAQMTVASSGGTGVVTTTKEWSYGDRWRAVTYSPAGHPVYDEGSSTAFSYIAVSYPTQTWARQPGSPDAPVPGSSGCERVAGALPLLLQPGLPGTGFSASSRPATVARELRAAISCGTLIVAGRQRAGGVEAIKLASSPDSQIPETIWVSPDTYLPVRVVARAAAKPGAPWLTADITWLRPTGQNLAKLTVPIPAGFRQVPAGSPKPK